MKTEWTNGRLVDPDHPEICVHNVGTTGDLWCGACLEGSSDGPAPGDPQYDGFRIKTVVLYTLIDPTDDQEGLPAYQAGGMVYPLMATDPVRAEQLLPIAKMIAQQRGVEVRITEMTVRTDVGRIAPDGTVTYTTKE